MTNTHKDLGAPFFVAGVGALFLIFYITNVLANRRFVTDLSAVIPEGLTFDAVSTGPFAYLMAGFIVKVVSLAVSIWGVTALLYRIRRGELFSRQSTKASSIAGYGLLGWLVGVFLEGMGDNFAARHLGIEQWASESLINNSTMVIVWLLITLVFIVDLSIKRAVKLEEDIDGLV